MNTLYHTQQKPKRRALTILRVKEGGGATQNKRKKTRVKMSTDTYVNCTHGLIVFTKKIGVQRSYL